MAALNAYLLTRNIERGWVFAVKHNLQGQVFSKRVDHLVPRLLIDDDTAKPGWVEELPTFQMIDFDDIEQDFDAYRKYPWKPIAEAWHD